MPKKALSIAVMETRKRANAEKSVKPESKSAASSSGSVYYFLLKDKIPYFKSSKMNGTAACSEGAFSSAAVSSVPMKTVLHPAFLPASISRS
jgi:hypothetical protein